MFSSFAMETASIGPTCELLLQLPAEKLEELLDSPRHREHQAKQRLQDYVSRLQDRIIDGSILSVLS
jgi:signal transduction protein with GAF and PtsI domain